MPGTSGKLEEMNKFDEKRAPKKPWLQAKRFRIVLYSVTLKDERDSLNSDEKF